MGTYSQENGYVPDNFNTIMAMFRENINDEFNTTFDENTFVGSNWYKFLYAPVQRILKNEISTSEVFLKLQEYIAQVNAKILNPSVSYSGLIAALGRAGFVASLKKIVEADAGKVFVCVDVDNTAPNYAAMKTLIAQTIEKYTVAGTVSVGSESEAVIIENGQSFDFKYALPNYVDAKLRVTFTLSENYSVDIPDDEDIRAEIFTNLNTVYRLGLNFEPQRVYNQSMALYADTVTVEYSVDDGTTWSDAVMVADFDDLLVIELNDISVVFS